MRPYYVFNDADVGRYWVDGEYREVLLAARELDVTLTQNRNWINDHLQYTHGYGVVVSPVNEVSRQQLPDFGFRIYRRKANRTLRLPNRGSTMASAVMIT